MAYPPSGHHGGYGAPPSAYGGAPAGYPPPPAYGGAPPHHPAPYGAPSSYGAPSPYGGGGAPYGGAPSYHQPSYQPSYQAPYGAPGGHMAPPIATVSIAPAVMLTTPYVRPTFHYGNAYNRMQPFFIPAMVPPHIAHKMMRASQIFRANDRDCNGVMDKKEFKKCCKHNGFCIFLYISYPPSFYLPLRLK
eukprot:TRINITY_DN2094_c0_g1_i1.p1 TRINITY_DN2094_c0_g1~~TRINITY_DN2094_c0_g1_i1.p1  ORF type:complete len:190 (+),score=43.38 TRINITY_DN2094_c0_g1_i1:111-680(+)